MAHAPAHDPETGEVLEESLSAPAEKRPSRGTRRGQERALAPQGPLAPSAAPGLTSSSAPEFEPCPTCGAPRSTAAHRQICERAREPVAQPESEPKKVHRPGPLFGGGRKKRERTPEELAALEVQTEYRARKTRLLGELSPVLAAEGDPPVRGDGLHMVPGDAPLRGTTLLEQERTTETGMPATLIVSARGAEGFDPYVLFFVQSHGAGGFRFRTHGTAIRKAEARAVGEALIKWARESAR